MSGPEDVFNCQKCGHCCEGKGGIILSDHDLRRLAEFLEMSPENAAEKYGEVVNGKLRLKAGANGHCIFLGTAGCAVHAGKPDICRAWPYFRGNLEDRASLAMAKEFCPGINPDVSFEQFAATGLAYLLANKLAASDGKQAANSLVITNLLGARPEPRGRASQTCPDAPVR